MSDQSVQERKISSKNVLLDGELVPATIHIHDGKIARIDRGSVLATGEPGNFGDLVVLPGLVDCHVHLNAPGRSQWEGFETGTKAAGFGGVTTVVEMPLNSVPPTTTVANLKSKVDAAQGNCYVDVAFWGGLVPDNIDDLLPLVKAGVRGFKCFLIDSGVPEFPMVQLNEVEAAMKRLQGQPTVLMFHAEMDCGHAHAESGHPAGNPHFHVEASDKTEPNPESYSEFLYSRPDRWERDAIDAVIKLGGQNRDLDLHIVHLATAEAVPSLVKAKKEGVRISAETCFHYLAFSAESVPLKNTLYKCCPPIRSKANQEELWKAVDDGVITSIVSDHSPCTPNLKLLDIGDFMQAWGGVASVGLGLPVLWTEQRLTLPQIAELCSLRTARQAGLEHLKGSIEVGKDADFCVFDPNVDWVFEQQKMHFKNKYTPYNGRHVRGRVVETILRGNTVFRHGEPFSTPKGRLILEPRTTTSQLSV